MRNDGIKYPWRGKARIRRRGMSWLVMRCYSLALAMAAWTLFKITGLPI